jgi:hypothetical protein
LKYSAAAGIWRRKASRIRLTLRGQRLSQVENSPQELEGTVFVPSGPTDPDESVPPSSAPGGGDLHASPEEREDPDELLADRETPMVPEPRPTAAVEPAPTAEAEPTPSSVVEQPSPTAAVEPAPTAEAEPTPSSVVEQPSPTAAIEPPVAVAADRAPAVVEEPSPATAAEPSHAELDHFSGLPLAAASPAGEQPAPLEAPPDSDRLLGDRETPTLFGPTSAPPEGVSGPPASPAGEQQVPRLAADQEQGPGIAHGGTNPDGVLAGLDWDESAPAFATALSQASPDQGDIRKAEPPAFAERNAFPDRASGEHPSSVPAEASARWTREAGPLSSAPPKPAQAFGSMLEQELRPASVTEPLPAQADARAELAAAPPEAMDSWPELARLRTLRWIVGVVVAALAVFATVAWLIANDRGELTITAFVPGGASLGSVEVSVDEKLRCEAVPCTVADLAAGQHLIRVTSTQHGTTERSVTTRSGVDYSADLVFDRSPEARQPPPPKASPPARAPPPGKASQPLLPRAANDLPVKAPDLPVKAPDLTASAPDLSAKAPDLTASAPDLSAKAPDLTASAPVVAPVDAPADVPERDPSTVRALKPKQATGTIKANSLPASKVLVDGRAVGQTPANVKAVPGKHTVSFVHPVHGRRDVVVEVKLKQESVAIVRFRPAAR